MGMDKEHKEAEAVLDGLSETKTFTWGGVVSLTKEQYDYVIKRAIEYGNSVSAKSASAEVIGLDITKMHCGQPPVSIRVFGPPVAPAFHGVRIRELSYCAHCGQNV